MSKDYNYWMTRADNHKYYLDKAIREKDAKNVVYYRGKYIFDLKQAYKLDHTGYVPESITGANAPIEIEKVIEHELNNHQRQIDACITHAKKNTSIKNASLLKEMGLKIRRLSTRVSQVDFASNTAIKKANKEELVKESLGLAATTLIKAPVMATAKVASKIGPLIITLPLLPLRVVASLLSATITIHNGKTPKYETYTNTPIDQLSDTLKEAVKKLSKTTYESIGKI